jgi:hypothetical protein
MKKPFERSTLALAGAQRREELVEIKAVSGDNCRTPDNFTAQLQITNQENVRKSLRISMYQ